MYSPRLRGLSEVIHVAIHVGGAFPPYAGVIGANRKSGCLKNGIPPRLRGLSVTFAQPQGSGLVFPPLAGVIGDF